MFYPIFGGFVTTFHPIPYKMAVYKSIYRQYHLPPHTPP